MLSLLLRSLTYQLALAVPGFLQKIVELADEAIDFERADPGMIWGRIFNLILSTGKRDGRFTGLLMA
jgi:hypothetical protein